VSFQHDAFQHNAFQVGAADAGPGFFLDEDTPGLPVRAPPWGWAIPQRQAVSDDEPIFASPSHGPSGGHRIIILPGVRARLSWWEDDGLAVAAAVALEDEPFLPQPPPGPRPVRSLFFDEDVLPNFILFEEEQFLPALPLPWKLAPAFIDDEAITPQAAAAVLDEEGWLPAPARLSPPGPAFAFDEDVLPKFILFEDEPPGPTRSVAWPFIAPIVSDEDVLPNFILFDEEPFLPKPPLPWKLAPAFISDEDVLLNFILFEDEPPGPTRWVAWPFIAPIVTDEELFPASQSFGLDEDLWAVARGLAFWPRPLQAWTFDEDVLPKFILFEDEPPGPMRPVARPFIAPIISDEDVPPTTPNSFDEDLFLPKPPLPWKLAPARISDEDVLPSVFDEDWFLPKPPLPWKLAPARISDEDVLPNFILFENEPPGPMRSVAWPYVAPFTDDEVLLPSILFENEPPGPTRSVAWPFVAPFTDDDVFVPPVAPIMVLPVEFVAGFAVSAIGELAFILDEDDDAAEEDRVGELTISGSLPANEKVVGGGLGIGEFTIPHTVVD